MTRHRIAGALAAATLTATLAAAGAPNAHVTASSRQATAGQALGQAHAHLATGQALLKYYGGTKGVGVDVHPKIYLVFWGSQWGTETTTGGNLTFAGDPASAAPYLQNFLRGLFGTSDTWSTSTTQYCQGKVVPKGSTTCPSGATFVHHPTATPLAGVWADESAAAPVEATPAQLGTEADNAAVHFGNTTPTSNRTTQYIVVSPTQTHPNGFNLPGTNFCAWHDFTGAKDVNVITPRGNIAFTNMPYVTDAGPNCGQGFVNKPGLLDGWSIVEGHEYAETVTDFWPQAPVGASVISTGGWFEPTKGENGDKCAWITPGTPGGAANIHLSTGTFAVQSLFSNASDSCVISYP